MSQEQKNQDQNSIKILDVNGLKVVPLEDFEKIISRMIKENSSLDVVKLISLIIEGKISFFSKEVKVMKSSGAIYVPKKYEGRKALVIL